MPPLDPTPAGPWVDAHGPTLGSAVGRLAGLPARVWRHRELVVASVRRDLRARLSGTLLGRAWTLLAPLVLFAVYWFVFTKLLGFKLPGLAPEHAPAMGIYMFLGVVVWTAFAESWTRCTHALVDNASLIKKVQFPAELLALEIVLAQLVTMTVALGVFALVAPMAGFWRWPGEWIAVAPLLLLMQAAFTTGLGLFTATLFVFLRDTAQFVALVATLWMFATPVFWVPSTEVLPGIGPWLALVEANPMHHLLYAWRAALMGFEPDICFGAPVGPSLGIFAVYAVASLVLGHTAFVLGSRRFADEV